MKPDHSKAIEILEDWLDWNQCPMHVDKDADECNCSLQAEVIVSIDCLKNAND